MIILYYNTIYYIILNFQLPPLDNPMEATEKLFIK